MKKLSVNGLCIAVALFTLPVFSEEEKGHDHNHNEKPHKQAVQTLEEHDHDQHAKDSLQKVDEHEEEGEHHEGEHEEEGEHDEHNEESGIKLSEAQIQLTGIKSEVITASLQTRRIYAPAEVKANGYTTYIVSPRVDSVVMKRHISLGEHIDKHQPLVTLFSAVIAQEQADYRINFAEYKRVKKLTSQVVSEKYKSDVTTRYEASLARLKAFGLTDSAITELSINKHSPLGEYTLEANQSGIVLSDNFQQGQRIEAGQSLIVLADESSLWVEASLSPNMQLALGTGTEAELVVNNTVFSAQIIQETHTIDPKTRTRIVRLLVKNKTHKLHSGMFGDVYFTYQTQQPVLAVPEGALMRSADGDWVVYVEENPLEFVAEEVELGRTLGTSLNPLREIIGLHSGEKIVTQGAFFIASEQAKNGFDPHNH